MQSLVHPYHWVDLEPLGELGHVRDLARRPLAADDALDVEDAVRVVLGVGGGHLIVLGGNTI